MSHGADRSISSGDDQSPFHHRPNPLGTRIPCPGTFLSHIPVGAVVRFGSRQGERRFPPESLWIMTWGVCRSGFPGHCHPCIFQDRAKRTPATPTPRCEVHPGPFPCGAACRPLRVAGFVLRVSPGGAAFLASDTAAGRSCPVSRGASLAGGAVPAVRPSLAGGAFLARGVIGGPIGGPLSASPPLASRVGCGPSC